MSASWKRLKTTQLFKHNRLNLYEDDVELPNGLRTKYLHFGHSHDAATVIAIDKNGMFLVQKEYSYPSNTWLYQFPGGKVEEGEKTTGRSS